MDHLFLKIFLAPSFVALASLAGRRWGLKISGWIATFPIVAGPILFFFALEQGNDFAARAAQGAVMALIGFSFFALTYAWSSRRLNLTLSVLVSWSVFAVTGFAVSFLSISLGRTWILAIGCLNLARILMPIVEKTKSGSPAIIVSPFDLPFRMTATAGLVLGLTLIAKQLGSSLSGIFAPFPVASTVLAGFAHYHEGDQGVARLLSGSLIGMQAFSVFCAIVSLTLVGLGIGVSFGLGLLGCGITQLLLAKVFSSNRKMK